MRFNRFSQDCAALVPFLGRSFGRLGALSALLIAGALLDCSGNDDKKEFTPDASASDGGDASAHLNTDASADASDAADPVASAAPAQAVSQVAFSREVDSTVYAGDNVLALFADKGLAPLDLTDPSAPALGPEETTDTKVIAVEYDATRSVAYAVDSSGKIYLYSLRSASGFKKLAEITVSALQNKVNGLTRLGAQLFALAGNSVVPISISFAGETPTGFMVGTAFSLGAGASHILAAGDSLQIATTGGELQSWTLANGTASKVGSLALGGEVRSLLAKGSKVFAGVKGVGLAVVDVGNPVAPTRIALDSSLHDIASAKLFGRTLVAALDRKVVSAVDVSDLSAPRVVTSNPGSAPKYVAVTNGSVLYGSGSSATVVNVPPTVTASVPPVHRSAFPLHGAVPITFSKPIDPASATSANVILTCGGKTISGTVLVSPDRTSITFLPTALLDPGVDCALDTKLVKDALGAAVQGGQRTAFKTASAATTVVTVPGSKVAHTPDGAFTGYQTDAGTWAGEWSDVTPAKGMYTYFYADFQDNKLNLLNDWFYNSDKIEPDCYNEFYVWTGNGTEAWTIRAYADHRVTVLKNGTALDPSTAGVTGGASYGRSPNVAEPHTIYELQIAAASGSWGVRLHDPGPTYHCSRLEADPTPMQGSLGTLGTTGTTIDTTQRPAVPPASLLASPANGVAVGTVTPVLSWGAGDTTKLSMSTYQIQISKREDFKYLVWNVSSTTPSYTVPDGVLAPNTTYYWRIAARNTAGENLSSTWSFSTAKAVTYTLTATKTGSGTISSSETDGARIQCGNTCASAYAGGTVVSLTARPDTGYVFNGWSGACSGKETTTTVTINADKTCTAEFVQATSSYTVSVATDGTGSGTITSLPAALTCTGKSSKDVCAAAFTKGTSIQLTATADKGSEFTGWTGDCESQLATVTLDMNAAKGCTAHFAAATVDAGTDATTDAREPSDASVPTDASDASVRYVVTVSNEVGTVQSSPSGIQCTKNEGTCSAFFSAGTTVKLTATPPDGYAFSGWDGDCSGSANPYTVEALAGALSCAAIFVPTPEPDAAPPIEAGPQIDASPGDAGAPDVAVPNDGGTRAVIYPGTYGPATRLAVGSSALYVGTRAGTGAAQSGGIVSYSLTNLASPAQLPGSLPTSQDLVVVGTNLFYISGENLARYSLAATDGAIPNTVFSLAAQSYLAADSNYVYWVDYSGNLQRALGTSDFTSPTVLNDNVHNIDGLAAYNGTAYWLSGADVYSSANGVTPIVTGVGSGYSISVPTYRKGDVFCLMNQADAGLGQRSVYSLVTGGGGLSQLDTQPSLIGLYADNNGAGLVYFSQNQAWWSPRYMSRGQSVLTDTGNISSAIVLEVNRTVPTIAWIRADGTVAAQTLTVSP